MPSRFFLLALSLILSFLPSVTINVVATAREAIASAAAVAKPELAAVAGTSAADSLLKCVRNAIDIPCLVNPCSVLHCPTGTQCVRDTCLPCKAHCETLPGQQCLVDANCGSNQWCRLGKCVNFVNDGESCGGFVPAELQRRCKPTSRCVQTNPNIPDLPGICRPKCKKNSDCYPPLVIRHWNDFWLQKAHYCSYDGVCLNRGQCLKAKDCYKPGNLFLSPYCVGFFRCKNGKCVKICLSKWLVAEPLHPNLPIPDPPVITEPRLVTLKHDEDESLDEDGNKDGDHDTTGTTDTTDTTDMSTGEFIEEEIAIDTENSDGSTGGADEEKKDDAVTTPTPEEPDQLVDEAEKEEEEEQDNEGKCANNDG